MERSYTVEFGSTKVTFYPLTVKTIRLMPEEMKALVGVRKGDDPFAPDRFEKLLRLWVISARHGNAGITEEQIENAVTLGHVPAITRVMLDLDPIPTHSASAEPAASVPEQVPTSPLIGGESARG